MRTKHGLVVHVEAPNEVRPRSEAITIFPFRAAREMVFNVVKNAPFKELLAAIRGHR